MKNIPTKLVTALMIATTLLGFAAVFNIAKALDTPHIFIDPASVLYPTGAPPNTEFGITVYIANITGLAGPQFTLNFDPTMLEALNYSEELFHDPLITKPADIPSNLQDYSGGIDNTAGTVSWAWTWKDGNKAKTGGYDPANITLTGSAYGNPTYSWPEGKHAMSVIFFKIIRLPTKAEGNLNCSLHFTDVIVGDANGLPITVTIFDGYYQIDYAMPTELPQFRIDPTATVRNDVNPFNVSVYVDNMDPRWEAVGFEFKVGYDDTILELTNVYEGPWLPPFGSPPNQGTSFMTFNATGYIQVGDVVLPDVNGTWHEPFPGSAPISGQPPGLLAYLEFKPIVPQPIYPDPDIVTPLDLYDTIVADRTAAVLNQTLPPIDGTVTIKSKFVATGRNIDIFTAWPYPYGGQGPNQPSDMFWPQKEVCLYANVTYNGWPEQRKDVAFQIIAPNGQTWAVVYARTDEVGIAKAQFRLPWPCDNPESWFGVWTVIGTVDIACIIVNDTVTFHYDYLFRIFKVTADHEGEPPAYNHDEYVCVTVEFGTYLWQPFINYTDQDTNATFYLANATVVMTGLDETHVPFGFAQDQSTSLAPEWHYCEYRAWNVTLCIPIPKFARAGIGEIDVAILDNWPFLGGTVQSGYYDADTDTWLPYYPLPIIINAA